MTLTSDFPPSVVTARSLALELGQGGGVAPEGVIVLTGSNFEAVSDPRPAAYDTFGEYSELSSGQAIPEGERWAVNGGSFHDAMILDSSVTLPGREFAAKTSARKAKLDGLLPYSGAPSKVADKHYTTFWARANEDINQQPVSADSIALKWCRIGTNGKNQTRPTLEQRKQWVAIENDEGTFLCPLSAEMDETDINSVAGCTNDRYRYAMGPLGQANQWVRIEVEIYSHTTASLVVNGNKVDLPYRKSPDDRDALPMLYVVGTDVGIDTQLNESYRGWIADVFEGVTPARVELSNSPTWSDSGMLRFYQKTILRTDDRIEFELFYGSLDPEQPLYVYVIKSDGSVNSSGILLDSDSVDAGAWV